LGGLAGEHEIARIERVGVAWSFDIFNDLRGGEESGQMGKKHTGVAD